MNPTRLRAPAQLASGPPTPSGPLAARPWPRTVLCLPGFAALTRATRRPADRSSAAKPGNRSDVVVPLMRAPGFAALGRATRRHTSRVTAAKPGNRSEVAVPWCGYPALRRRRPSAKGAGDPSYRTATTSRRT